jgi:hypothetical protein
MLVDWWPHLTGYEYEISNFYIDRNIMSNIYTGLIHHDNTRGVHGYGWPVISIDPIQPTFYPNPFKCGFNQNKLVQIRSGLV